MVDAIKNLLSMYKEHLTTYESQLDPRFGISCCQETTVGIVKQFIENLESILNIEQQKQDGTIG